VGRSRWYVAALGLAAALIAMVPAAALGSKYFKSGRTAGEITDHSAIVWARTSREIDVRAKVATNDSFRNLVANKRIEARNRNNRTVQTEIHGLKPGHTYSYRFCVVGKGTCSARSHFETAPAPNDAETIRFAYTGDETGVSEPGGADRPFWGFMRAWKTITAEDNDFNIDFGDTIYSDPEVPGWGDMPALTVPEKWAMYRKKLALRNMRMVRGATGMYNHWDDHEFINDFSIPENGRELYNHGVRAFRDFMPVHYSNSKGIYRTVRWGKNLELFFLDERSFRSAKASANGVCDNPDTGEPDLAPTAPQDKRNLFGALIPSLREPVSQQCKRKINSRQRTMLGKAQLQRFLDDVESSNARWKVVMNETPIQQYYALPYDRWEGYAYERIELLRALQNANVNDLVFLTTDTHAAFANIVRLRTLEGDVAPSNAPAATPSDTPYSDFIIGPVATTPFWQEIDEATGREGNGELFSRVFFKPPPQQGVGMSCAQGGQNSYAEVTVTRGSLTIEYKKADGSPVVDVDGSTQCGPYVLTR
jgi:phosphodiesterase/alkaline phosphatase D-like protein